MIPTAEQIRDELASGPLAGREVVVRRTRAGEERATVAAVWEACLKKGTKGVRVDGKRTGPFVTEEVVLDGKKVKRVVTQEVKYVDGDLAHLCLVALNEPGTRTRTVAAPLDADELEALLEDEDFQCVFEHATYPQFLESVEAQDRAAVASWVATYRRAGLITPEEAAAIGEYLGRTEGATCSRCEELGWDLPADVTGFRLLRAARMEV